jgi:hypothetical protein
VKHELIGRYIYAVVRHLPQKQRAEVEKELDSLISDMLDARCGDILPADKDVKVVLTELGTPDELAAKYSGEEQKSLISGVYFIAYKRVLKIVLPIVAAVAALVISLSAISDPPENPALFALRVIGQTLGGTLGGVVQAFAVITLIFAILERTKTDLSGDYLSDLPLVPKQTERIRLYGPIIGIFWSVVFAVVFLGFPQIIGGWFGSEGWIPVFNITLLRSLWLPILLWTVLGVAQEIVALFEGRYTKKLASVTVVTNVLSIGCAAIVFLNREIMNFEFKGSFSGLFPEAGGFILSADFSWAAILFAILCAALLTESITVSVKAWRYSAL